MITLFELYYQNEKCIGIKSLANQKDLQRLKSLKALRYIPLKNYWYLPYDKEVYRSFQALSIPYCIESSTGTIDDLPSKNENSGITRAASRALKKPNVPSTIPPVEEQFVDVDIKPNNQADQFNIAWNGSDFRLSIRYKEKDSNFLKSLKGSYWNRNFKCWVIRGSLFNLKELQSYFLAWSKKEYQKLVELISLKSHPQVLTFYTSPQYLDKVLIKATGFGIDLTCLKSIPNREYDKQFKRWIVPHDPILVKRVTEYYESRGAKIINRIPKARNFYVQHIPKNSQRLERLLSKCEPFARPTIEKFAEMLLRQQYGWTTIRSYCNKLYGLLFFYKPRNLADLTAIDCQYYLAQLAKKDVSNSLLNVIFSAIKLYYEKVEFVPNFDLTKLKRPRKGKHLPTILSIGEVDRMLRTVKNLKHLTILYTIYGGGLRLKEIINLRIQDIHWDRNQLKVTQGKGKKDRMVMLSKTLKELLQNYFATFQPQYWLFEGKDGNTQYSARSIQQIVKRASTNAHITRRVTPHTLRHCFATHLLDNGTDIRYIQELLGHRDIKTTLIYTHVTTHSIGQIVSPLDQLKGE